MHPTLPPVDILSARQRSIPRAWLRAVMDRYTRPPLPFVVQLRTPADPDFSGLAYFRTAEPATDYLDRAWRFPEGTALRLIELRPLGLPPRVHGCRAF